jgi:hypothetical protein
MKTFRRCFDQQTRKDKMNYQKTATNKQIFNVFFIYLFWLSSIGSLYVGIAPGSRAEDRKKGDIVTIVTPGTEARLCPQPGCGPDQHITRIPAGTVFTVQNTEVFAIGTFKVKWFEVIYDNQHGWISIFDTDKSKK